MNEKQIMSWEQWLIFSNSCENASKTQGGQYCILDGIRGYCGYHGCDKRRKG